ncbi:aldo/keto reductase [Candidatus Roizmanbacteria bacterium]|nr:MAG: aldo/keto reductase [Candidatus Roizmanbacteria bacterium]
MIIPTKKLKSGFEMPVFGLGTWQMGGREERNPENNDGADIEAIKRAIEAGISHIDTAEMYAAGHAEELVGMAISGFDRNRLFLTSKVLDGNQTYDGVMHAVHGSLKRLGTEYLDLYLIHAPDESVHISETMRAMDDVVDQKLVKNIGLSNFSVKQFEQAQQYARHKIVTNQVHYNLEIREIEKNGALSYYQLHDVMITAWRPLQKSIILTDGAEILRDIGKKYTKTPAQVAINWLISQHNVVTMSTMRDWKHLEENLGAIDWELSDRDIEYLRREFPHQKPISDVYPLSDNLW